MRDKSTISVSTEVWFFFFLKGHTTVSVSVIHLRIDTQKRENVYTPNQSLQPPFLFSS